MDTRVSWHVGPCRTLEFTEQWNLDTSLRDTSLRDTSFEDTSLSDLEYLEPQATSSPRHSSRSRLDHYDLTSGNYDLSSRHCDFNIGHYDLSDDLSFENAPDYRYNSDNDTYTYNIDTSDTDNTLGYSTHRYLEQRYDTDQRRDWHTNEARFQSHDSFWDDLRDDYPVDEAEDGFTSPRYLARYDRYIYNCDDHLYENWQKLQNKVSGTYSGDWDSSLEAEQGSPEHANLKALDDRIQEMPSRDTERSPQTSAGQMWFLQQYRSETSSDSCEEQTQTCNEKKSEHKSKKKSSESSWSSLESTKNKYRYVGGRFYCVTGRGTNLTYTWEFFKIQCRQKLFY